MMDNYTHVEPHLIYVIENVPGPMELSKDYEELFDSMNSQLVNCCECTQDCEYPTCNCIQKSGGINYIAHIKHGRQILRLNDELLNTEIHPILECNNLCPCTDCTNRLVQKGPKEGLIIKMCNMTCKGWGLFTKILIPKGSFICEYAGEVITKSQAIERQKLNSANGKRNYIFCLNEFSGGTVIQTFVDPGEIGNIGRYVNHSCDPNCQIIPVRCNTPTPKLAIFSCKDILEDEEITFDYGSHKHNIAITKVGNRIKCLCGSNRCREFMPYDVY